MPKSVTDGVTTLLARTAKKTGYHKDDVSVIVYAMFDELRAMMEENAARRISFKRFGSFDVVKLKAQMVYHVHLLENKMVPERYTPKFKYNKEMVKNIKKIPVKNG